jgi:hypothetical protein
MLFQAPIHQMILCQHEAAHVVSQWVALASAIAALGNVGSAGHDSFARVFVHDGSDCRITAGIVALGALLAFAVLLPRFLPYEASVRWFCACWVFCCRRRHRLQRVVLLEVGVGVVACMQQMFCVGFLNSTLTMASCVGAVVPSR